MIDIHHHILPDLEGGAKHMEETLSIAKAAADGGITTLIAIPQSINGNLSASNETVKAKVMAVNDRLAEDRVPLTVVSGQKLNIHNDMMDNNDLERLLTIKRGNEYLFVELPSGQLPGNMWELMFDLQRFATPVIVQPELHPAIQENPDMLYQQVKNGMLVQVGADSIVGNHGGKVKKFVNQLIEANLVHFVASGNPGEKGKSFHLKRAYTKITKVHGSEIAAYLEENISLLLENEPIVPLEPQHVRVKKLLGFI